MGLSGESVGAPSRGCVSPWDHHYTFVPRALKYYTKYTVPGRQAGVEGTGEVTWTRTDGAGRPGCGSPRGRGRGAPAVRLGRARSRGAGHEDRPEPEPGPGEGRRVRAAHGDRLGHGRHRRLRGAPQSRRRPLHDGTAEGG